MTNAAPVGDRSGVRWCLAGRQISPFVSLFAVVAENGHAFASSGVLETKKA
jgi:hypothetical protein